MSIPYKAIKQTVRTTSHARSDASRMASSSLPQERLTASGEEMIQTFLRSIELFCNCLMPEVSDDMILCDFIMKYCNLYIIKFLFYSLLAKSSVKIFI